MKNYILFTSFISILLLNACSDKQETEKLEEKEEVIETQGTGSIYEWFDIVSDTDEIPIYPVGNIEADGKTIKDLFENEKYTSAVYGKISEVEDKETLIKTIRNAMLNYDIRFGIKYKGSEEDMKQIIAEAYYSHPMILGTVTYLFFAEEKIEQDTYLHFEVLYTTNKIEMVTVNKKFEEFYDQLKLDGKSDDEKISIIHRAVIEQIEYVDTGNMHAHSPYGFFISGEGVCQSYAIAMQMLLEKAGIKSEYVVGYMSDDPNKEAHAWNLVKTEDGWRHIDATNNDLGADYEDQVSFTFYKLTDALAKENYVWDETFYPKAE